MGGVWLLGLLACCALVSTKELTEAEKKILSEKLGINLDDLRARLEKLGPHANTTEHTENHPAQADGIPPLSNGVVDEHDILLVNQRSVMAPYLYQGDIMMTAEQLTYLETIKNKSLSEADRARTKRQATKVYAKWDREIFYLVDNNVSNKTKMLIGKAVKYLEERTALKFRTQYPVPEGIRNQLHIVNWCGCWSYIGMRGGIQYLSLGTGCGDIGIIVHEVMHALGINHMQTRSDRDEYVTYIENNVFPDTRHNFVKMTEAESENYTPYEYGSVMHYAATAGAMTAGAMALVPKDDAYLRTMGGHRISFYDMIMINNHYANFYEGAYGPPDQNYDNKCAWGCPYNGMEVKTNANPRIVNPRVCCPEQMNTTYISNVNPTQIIFYNRISYSNFSLKYRYVDGDEPCTAKDALAESTCQSLKSNGYCTSSANSIDVIKFTCGQTCELCGKCTYIDRLFYVLFSTRLFQPLQFKIAVHCLDSFFIDWSLLMTMIEIGLIIVYSSLVVLTLLTCGGTKNGKATAPPPGVLGAPTKDAAPATTSKDAAPAPATAASSTVGPAPAPEASSTVAPTPSSAISPAAPSVDRADAPSDVSTASPAVSTASPPTVATAASPSVATAASPTVLTAASPAILTATSPLVFTATLHSDSFTESIKKELTRSYIKCVGAERPSGEYGGISYGPSNRYCIIMLQSSEGKPLRFPVVVMDVCLSSYTVYTHDKSDERIEQIRNGKFYWLADDLIVIVLFKHDQLLRYIYELDHEKKTVSFVYAGEDTCWFLLQSTGDPINTIMQVINIQNRKYIMIVGRDYRRFQLFNRDPRVAPRYPHSFLVDVPTITNHLRLTGPDTAFLGIPLCGGSKINFLLVKQMEGLNEDVSITSKPTQILRFDLEKVVEKQPDGLADTVTIGAGDKVCWSVMTLELVEPDIALRFPASFSIEPTHLILSFSKAHTDKARTNIRVYMVIIDFSTKKCYKKKFTTKRDVSLDIQLYPYLKIEERTWDKTSGGLSWTTLKTFPPTKVATLQDLARDAVMRNRQKYTQILPDLANIVFPL